MSGIDAMIAIGTEFSEVRIIMLTTFEGDVEIQRALHAGARGYPLKEHAPKDLVEVIRQVHAGKKRIPAEVAAHLAEHFSDESLTARESDDLRYIADGSRNRISGKYSQFSEETVKLHITLYGEAGGQRPHTGRCDSRAPRHHPVVKC